MNFKIFLDGVKEHAGDLLKVGGALGTMFGAIYFGREYAEFLRDISWQETTKYVSWGLSAYGAGELYNTIRANRLRANAEEPESVKGPGVFDGALKSVPVAAVPLAYATGDALQSLILPATACIVGYAVETVARLGKNDKR